MDLRVRKTWFNLLHGIYVLFNQTLWPISMVALDPSPVTFDIYVSFNSKEAR